MTMSSSTKNKTTTTAAAAQKQQQHPLDTAILYSSPYSIGCAHAIPLRQAVARFVHNNNDNTCPICNKPVTYIEDACVSKKDYDTTAFKIGKLHMRLSVPPLSVWKSNNDWQHHMPLASAVASTMSYWWNPLSWLTRKQQQQQHENLQVFGTAQARIARVLQLQHLKILSKGKVLFPPPPPAGSSSSTITTTTTTTSGGEPQSQMMLQQLLLEDNKHDTSSNKTLWLLVMGTTRTAAKQLAAAAATTHATTTTTTTSLFQTMLQVVRHCLIWTLNVMGGAVAKARQWLRLAPPQNNYD